MIGLGAAFGAGSVLVSNLVGPRKPSPEKSAPYECGVPPVGDARERHPVQFYLVAMIFLLFDIEVAFLYPWAMALRERGDGGGSAGRASSRSSCSWRSCWPATSPCGARGS